MCENGDSDTEIANGKRPDMRWRTFRNALQKVHLWVGLIFMVPIILIGISGSIIVLMQSIPDLVLPAATARGEPQSIATVIAAAEAATQGAGMVDAGGRWSAPLPRPQVVPSKPPPRPLAVAPATGHERPSSDECFSDHAGSTGLHQRPRNVAGAFDE
jgi:PepSY-associated TM region